MSISNDLCFDSIRFRNFLSYGNNDTEISLYKPGTTLIIGEDVDAGTGSSNGVGKSSILNAIVYALFDRPLSKDIKLDDMINNVNKKNLEVAIKFHKGMHHYEIVRQRKGKDGNTVKLYIDDELKTLDSIDNTNKFIIEKIIGYSYDVFVRIVVFSANHEPFFSLPTSGTSKTTQTDIIEELFSLTALTLKATKAKAEIKENEQKVELIKVKLEQIDQEKERHQKQIASVQQRHDDWEDMHSIKIARMQKLLDEHKDTDFDNEITALTNLHEYKQSIEAIVAAKIAVVGWQDAQNRRLLSVIKDRNKLKNIDFVAEQKLHTDLAAITSHLVPLRKASVQHKDWATNHSQKLSTLRAEAEKLSAIDFDAQYELFDKVATTRVILDNLHENIISDQHKLQEHTQQQRTLQDELAQLQGAKCPYCKQDYHTAAAKIIDIAASIDTLNDTIDQLNQCINNAVLQSEEHNSTIDAIGKSVVVNTLSKLHKLKADADTMQIRLAEIERETNPYEEMLAEFAPDITTNRYVLVQELINQHETMANDISEKITTPSAAAVVKMQAEFDNLNSKLEDLQEEANPHTTGLEKLIGHPIPDADEEAVDEACEPKLAQLKGLVKSLQSSVVFTAVDVVMKVRGEFVSATSRLKELGEEENPFIGTLAELMEVKLDELDYDEINRLQKIIDHQKFLVKLLTKSDSFIRKALIDKNIPLLNEQLRIYLKTLGLSHRVEFTNTMTAAITQMGRPLSYNNLSTGQKARINLALAWAFRDVLQKMHSKVNFCLLDEVLDAGLCPYGITAAAKMLKVKANEDKLTMFIISHRDELNSTFDYNMKVQLQNGFSHIPE